MKMSKIHSVSLAIAAALLVTATACQKDNSVQPSGNASFSGAQNIARITAAPCDDVATGTSSNSFTGSSFGSNVYYYNLAGSGSASLNVNNGVEQISFSSFFSSYVKGVNGWKVGYFDTTGVTYAGGISGITCSTITSYGHIDTDNSIGADGYPGATDIGWYYYDFANPGTVFRPHTILFAWYDCDQNGCINSGDKVYVFKVSINLSNPPSVSIQWKGINVSCTTNVCQ